MPTTRELKRAEARRLARDTGPEYFEVPSREWPIAEGFGGVTRVFRNNLFVVLVYDNDRDPEGRPAILARMRPNNGKPLGPSLFRLMQDCKNQIFGPEARGCMYLPKESELVDEANLYWFYILKSAGAGVGALLPDHEDATP